MSKLRQFAVAITCRDEDRQGLVVEVLSKTPNVMVDIIYMPGRYHEYMCGKTAGHLSTD